MNINLSREKYCLRFWGSATFSSALFGARMLGMSAIFLSFIGVNQAWSLELDVVLDHSSGQDVNAQAKIENADSEGLEDERVTVEIKNFSINWNPEETKLQKLNYNQLLHEWLAELGPDLTISQMHMIAARLTRKLRELGYQFHSVVVPQQNLTNGVLKLELVEGVVGLVDVRNNSYYKTNLIGRPLMDLQNLPIYQPQMEEAVALVNEYPGLSVFSYYSRGNRTGEANVNISVVEEERFSSRVQFDNYGSESTGANRLSLGFAWYNPAGLGDSVELSLLSTTSSKNSIYGSVEYQLPLGSPRHLARMTLSRNSFELGSAFTDLQLSGEAEGLNIRYQYKQHRSQNSALNFNISYSQNTSDIYTDLSDLTALLDRTEQSSSARAGWDGYQFSSSRVFGWGASLSYVSGDWKVILPEMNSSEGSRLFNYQKLDVSQWAQLRVSSPENWYAGLLSLHVEGQYGRKPVPAAEKMGLTGPTLVRAERTGLYSSDRGAFGQVEWRWLYSRWLVKESLSRSITPGVFYQEAYGEQLATDLSMVSDAKISSAGVALDLNYKGISMNLSYAELLSLEIDSIQIQNKDPLILAKVAYQW